MQVPPYLFSRRRGRRMNGGDTPRSYAIVVSLILLLQSVKCQQIPAGDDFSEPALPQLITQEAYSRLSNFTATILNGEISVQSGFCIENREEEWNRAFNFSSNLTFLSNCIQKTNGLYLEKMRSGHMIFQECDGPRKKIPTLVDLCVREVIDNLRHLGDVGETDFHLLERFLPHCTVEQLMHVEDSTKGRDLSPVTDKLWKKFYELKFSSKSTNLVVERMKQKKVTFKWRQLYEAKLKDMEEAQQKSFERIKQLYEKEVAKKQSRQIQFCTKVPPSSKRFFGGAGPGCSIGNTKSGLMKKAKLEFLNSREVKNLTAMKKTNVRNNYSASSSIRKPTSFSGSRSSSCASSSKDTNPMVKRF